MEPHTLIPVNQFKYFPGTRYMGSKNKIIGSIWKVLSKLNFNTCFDCFGGSNVVGYFLKCQGKQIYTNDFLSFSYIHSKAIIENSSFLLNEEDYRFLLKPNKNNEFIQNTFSGIFFTDEENKFLDIVRHNISEMQNEYKRAIALSALIRTCMKKRSRGIFTYVGHRYDDGRADLVKSMESHFHESIDLFNKAIFDNNFENKAYNGRSEELFIQADLIYLDPPYFSPKSDNDYLRRYHFLEGLVKKWENISIQENSAVKKFASYKSPFDRKQSAYNAFEALFKKYEHSIIAISYSSNSLPTKDELLELLKKYKSSVEVHEIDHTYSFGNQNHKIGNLSNRVKEYLFIGN